MIAFEIDRDNLKNTVEWMTKHAPYRLAGSETEARAAEYVVARMAGCGLESKLLTFNAYNSTPMSSSLKVVFPVETELKSLPCAHIECTPPDGAEYELVYVGNGTQEAYDGVDIRGKLALIEVSYAPPVPEKARIAAKLGAAGIVCMNWGNDEEVICHRGLKAVWGNPTEDTVGEIPRIIGLGITRNDGLMLKELCAKGKVIVHANAQADRTWTKVHQPFGILRGSGESDEFILVASHLDAWQPGVTCNATGNATTLELCRLLAAQRDELRRDIWFVFWSGHEIAEAAGSTWFADNYWDELDRNCVGYINIDSTGVSQTELFEIKASDELLDLARSTAKSVMPGVELRTMPLKKIGDQSFMGIGIPAVAQRMSFTAQYMERNHGATLGWWNHTCEDGLDKYDLDTLCTDTEVTAALIAKLGCEKRLHYDIMAKVESVSSAISALEGNGYIDMGAIAEKARLAQSLARRVAEATCSQSGEYDGLWNAFAVRTSHILTNVLQTYAPRYGQDSYGYTKLTAALPLMYDLKRLASLGADSMEYGMLETALIRNRNRISDALGQAMDCARLYLSLVERQEK